MLELGCCDKKYVATRRMFEGEECWKKKSVVGRRMLEEGCRNGQVFMLAVSFVSSRQSLKGLTSA